MRKTTKKSLIMMEILVFLIVGLVVFIILLKFGGAFFHLIRDSGEDFGCTLSAILNAYTKIYGGSIFKLNCPVKFVKVLEEDIDLELAENEIKYLSCEIQSQNLNEKCNPKTVNTRIVNDLKEEEKEYQFRKYNLNQIIANEMKQCWTKLGRGEMPLFSQEQWTFTFDEKYKHISDEKKGKVGYPLTSAKGLAERFGLYTKDAPTVCVICSTIDFDDELDDKLKNKEIELDPWLKNNPAKDVRSFSLTSIDYFTFLLDDVFKNTAFRPGYTYTTNPDEPLAIVFARTNAFYLFGISGAKDTITKIKNIFSKKNTGNEFAGVDSIRLAPYSKLRKRLEGENIVGLCDEIAG